MSLFRSSSSAPFLPYFLSLLLSFLISFLRILLTSSFCNDFSTFSNLLRPQAHLTIFFFVIFQFLLQILLFINKLDLDDNNIQICFMNGGISLSIRDRACDILYKYSLCVCMVKDSEEDVVVWELYTQSNHFPGGGCVQARILANLYHYHITQWPPTPPLPPHHPTNRIWGGHMVRKLLCAHIIIQYMLKMFVYSATKPFIFPPGGRTPPLLPPPPEKTRVFSCESHLWSYCLPWICTWLHCTL